MSHYQEMLDDQERRLKVFKERKRTRAHGRYVKRKAKMREAAERKPGSMWDQRRCRWVSP